MQPFLDSTDVQRDTDELKQRLARDGYLYLRGFLPTDAVETVRRRWLHFANQQDGFKSLRQGMIWPTCRHFVQNRKMSTWR